MTVDYDYQYYIKVGNKDIPLTVLVRGYSPDKTVDQLDVKLSFYDLDGHALIMPVQFYRAIRFNDEYFDNILVEYGDDYYYRIKGVIG
jgi:hypothetical protein